MSNPFLARFDCEPALVNPEAQGRFSALLNGIASHELAPVVMSTEFASNGDFWTELGEYRTKLIRPYAVKNGVLHIPVKGVLLKDFPYQFFGYATGYEYIRAAFDRGMADPEVKGIALVFDTPGGMVAGNFDLVDHIYGARGEKPIAGFAMEHSYSAGYSLLSAADPGRVYVARTGGVGSIGVVTSHVDASAAMEKWGYKITLIYAGKHKVDGNPYEALPDDVKARIQARVDDLYSIFVATVARNRSLKEKAVRDTDALTFSAAEAVSNGLADQIGTLDDAIAAFAADLSKTEDDQMTTKDTAAVDQAAIETARTEGHAAGKTEGHAAGMAEGAKAERTRITTILGSDEGKARPAMALKMATNEKFAALDADTIAEMLAEMPKEQGASSASDDKTPKGKEGAANDFRGAMNSAEHPNVGADGGRETPKAQQRAQRALSMIGHGPKAN